jgi:4'-phosphopantetheinyl transferase
MTVRPINDVQVWTIATDEPALVDHLAQYDELLSGDERQRVQRFRQPADRVRFVLARALARTMLSTLAPLDPRAWRFRITAHGRPDLDMTGDLAHLRFNLSHTSGLVACAVAVGCDVGVDVECVDRSLTHDIAERFFSPREVGDLRSLPDGQRSRVFFDYWTLKEAYIKARGLGLAIPLDHFSFVLQPPAPPHIVFEPELPDDPARWQFVQSTPTPHHRLGLAICSGGRPRPVRFDAVRPEALIA